MSFGFLAFLTGFFCLSLEVLGAQITFFYHAQSSQAVGLSLCAFLAGLAAASFCVHRLNEWLLARFDDVICAIFVAGGLVTMLLLGHFDRGTVFLISALRQVGYGGQSLYQASFSSLCFFLLFLPAVTVGLLFPLVNDRYFRESGRRDSSTGLTNFYDLLGAGAGALVAGWILIPQLGLEKSCQVVGAAMVACAWLWCRSRPGAAILSLATIAAALDLRAEVPTGAEAFGKVIHQAESPYGKVTVGTGRVGRQTLFINQRSMCVEGSDASERELAHAPFVYALKGNLRVLNIGLGCGFTADELSRNPQVKELEIAEINPVVARIAATYFREANHRLLERSGVHLQLEEGYHYLQNAKGSYDLIVVDIEEPTIVHSSALYTKEFFELAARRLSPDGLLVLWSFRQAETNRIILNTLAATFRSAEVSLPQSGFIFFVAANRALPPGRLPRDAFYEKIEQARVTDVATIARNPYAKYYDLREIFRLEPSYRDPSEIRDLPR